MTVQLTEIEYKLMYFSNCSNQHLNRLPSVQISLSKLWIEHNVIKHRLNPICINLSCCLFIKIVGFVVVSKAIVGKMFLTLVKDKNTLLILANSSRTYSFNREESGKKLRQLLFSMSNFTSNYYFTSYWIDYSVK